MGPGLQHTEGGDTDTYQNQSSEPVITPSHQTQSSEPDIRTSHQTQSSDPVIRPSHQNQSSEPVIRLTSEVYGYTNTHITRRGSLNKEKNTNQMHQLFRNTHRKRELIEAIVLVITGSSPSYRLISDNITAVKKEMIGSVSRLAAAHLILLRSRPPSLQHIVCSPSRCWSYRGLWGDRARSCGDNTRPGK